MIGSPDAAARALCNYFLANADRGENAANDELVAELVRRIRVQQAQRRGSPMRTALKSQRNIDQTASTHRYRGWT